MEQDEIISFATFNIDQARREEDYENTKFDNRWPKIKALIKECDSDIINIQEMRNLSTSDISVQGILYQLSEETKYDYAYAYYDKTPYSFALGIFFRRDKFAFTAGSVEQLPLFDKVKHQPRILQLLRFESIKTGKEFYIGCTHFDVNEDEKYAPAHFIRLQMDTLSKQNYPVIVAGDFNFFDDLDGKKHRAIIEESYKDLAYPLENASGTFIGFEHDAFKQPFEHMSRLDHIFANEFVELIGKAKVIGDLEAVKKREYASDHLLIKIHFRLK